MTKRQREAEAIRVQGLALAAKYPSALLNLAGKIQPAPNPALLYQMLRQKGEVVR